MSKTALGTARPIRVLLADDHAVMREGLTRLIAEQPDIEVVGEASDGQEAVELAHRLRPSVVLMDVSMPRLGGIEATERIVATDAAVHVIGLSMHEDAEMASAMRDAGAVAYLSKNGPPVRIIAAIRATRAPTAVKPPNGSSGPKSRRAPRKALKGASQPTRSRAVGRVRPSTQQRSTKASKTAKKKA